MSVTLKKDSWKIKDPTSGDYRDGAIFSTVLPYEASTIVQDSEEQMSEIAEAIASMAEFGTDKTLTIEGAAADAKAVGDVVKNSNYNIYNVLNYGAKGDGITDDSIAIRNCIVDLPESNFILYFPPGVYLQGDGTNPDYTYDQDGKISPTTQNANIGDPIYFLLYQKHDFIISGYDATVLAHPNNTCIQNNRGFELSQCYNAVIEGLTYNGNIENRQPHGGDNGKFNNQSAFRLTASKNIVFRDLVAIGAVMDGFMLQLDLVNSEYVTCDDCIFINCRAVNSYRQGMSIVGARRGKADHCYFGHTGSVYGTLPMSGVDLESSLAPSQENWVFDHCVFESNSGSGITLSSHAEECTIDNCIFYNDSIQIVETSPNQRNATVQNCSFYGSNSIRAGGGGLLFQNNYVELSAFLIMNKSNALKAIRANRIINNTFKYNFDISEETISNGYVSTIRGLTLRDSDCEIEGNRFINFTGVNSIISTTSTIKKFKNNRFITDIEDYKTYCDYLGNQGNINISYEMHGNSADSAYKFMHDSGAYVFATNSGMYFLGYFSFNTSHPEYAIKLFIGDTNVYKVNKDYIIKIKFGDYNDMVILYNSTLTPDQTNRMTYTLSEENGMRYITFLDPNLSGNITAPLSVGISRLGIDIPSSNKLSAERISINL